MLSNNKNARSVILPN